MTAEQLFSILNLTTMAAWVLLVCLPRVRWTATLVPVAVPSLLAVVYVGLVAATLGRSEGGFSSLAGVRALFDNPWMLLAGWTHYLAFDLFIGGWEVRDAQRRGVPHLLIVPSLVLTFLLGPAGLLLYFATRWSTATSSTPATTRTQPSVG
jgi:ABA4-like protein